MWEPALCRAGTRLSASRAAQAPMLGRWGTSLWPLRLCRAIPSNRKRRAVPSGSPRLRRATRASRDREHAHHTLASQEEGLGGVQAPSPLGLQSQCSRRVPSVLVTIMYGQNTKICICKIFFAAFVASFASYLPRISRFIIAVSANSKRSNKISKRSIQRSVHRSVHGSCSASRGIIRGVSRAPGSLLGSDSLARVRQP